MKDSMGLKYDEHGWLLNSNWVGEDRYKDISEGAHIIVREEEKCSEKGLTEFESYLRKHKIRLIVGRVNHPQSNGKIEKFFDIFESKIRCFSSIDEFVHWYICIRLYGAFDISKLETPVKVYYQRMPQRDVLMDPSLLLRGGGMICG
ncbi:MAG: hypothetical protein QXV32_09530 [Conexivisphaerales archaeon]